ncbi:PucR family transcriptional regulator [Patulibacter defluvii]|uniref:PucR family transcriptional regulator n=1 Tax=Patulibacter defluvii TaxID=3095358 RepID=UPI002A74D677|nr:helix-turn-helix domain-containing protein [Patulibacter sp. DM4]
MDVGALVPQLSGVLHVDPAVEAVGMAQHILDHVPEFAEATARRPLLRELRACCAVNIEAVMRLIDRGSGPAGTIVVPDVAREFTVAMVHRRVPKAALIRGYRIGHSYLWSTLMRRLSADPEANLALADQLADLLFAYVDNASEAHDEIYEVERASWVPSADELRLQTAQNVLSREVVDPHAASGRLSYDLNGVHVAMVVHADPGDPDVPGRQQLVAEATGALSAIGPVGRLLIPAAPSELWVWAAVEPERAGAALERLEARAAAAGLHIAIGRPRPGIEGFRLSHEEARKAADLSRPSDRSPVSYRHVEFFSLLLADDERCGRFVRETLGELAGPGTSQAALRRTLLAYFEASGSYVTAAESLFLHKNTVYARVRRAETVLERTISPADVTLHAALKLAAVLPELVLDEPANPL